MFPENPVLEQIAESLFGPPDSQWSPSKQYLNAASPLIAIPAFRRAVMSALEHSTVVGGATRTAYGSLTFSFPHGGGGAAARGYDPRQAPPGVERPIRTMDLVAWAVSTIEGAPEFELDWSTADKDAALPAIRSFLNTNGSNLRVFPSRFQDMSCPAEHVYVKRRKK